MPSEASDACLRGRGWPGWADLTALVVAGAVLSVVYCVASWPRPIAPPLTGWVLTWFCMVLPVTAGIRAARDPVVAPEARRFWARIAATMTVLDVGVVSITHDALTGPGAPSLRISATSTSIFLAGLTMLLCTLLLVPAGQRSVVAWITFALDAGTVATGSSLFLWHFSFRSTAWAAVTGTAQSLLAILALGSLGVLVLLKIAFAGVRGLDPGSLRLLAAAAAFSTGLASLTPLMASRPYLTSTFLGMPIGCVFVVLSARQQQRAAWADEAARNSATTAARVAAAAPIARPRSRALSVLPYAAVALTDGLLLVSVRSASDQLVVAIGVVVLTALVVARQIIASRENDRLLRRLDRTVAELRESEDRLSHQASHDELTGLANRALFGRRVQTALTAATDPTHIAVALVDLDDFKIVNDRLGHIVGDALLIATADRLRTSVQPGDIVARLGGDEFAILLDHTHQPDGDLIAREPPGLPGLDLPGGDLPGRVAAILGGLAEPLTVTGQELLIRASLGIATGTPGADPLELLRRADIAMYAAKEQGNGGWARYHPGLDAHAVEQARIGAAIRNGLTRGEFHLLYQPIVALPDGQLLGVEALIRWSHPQRGTVNPVDFIPHAERTGLIIPLGRWVLEEACRQGAAWRHRYGRDAPARISVNVSPRQLGDPALVNDIITTLDRTGLPASCLVIEVTESAVVDGGAATTETLRTLRTLGIRVALDDFGTGHSSLGLLLTCPVDILKVDKSFVDGVTHHGDQAVIVTFLADVADGLHLQTVAEGVETPQQASRLHELGYRQAQGYHFARPLRPDQVEALITTHASV